MSDTIEKIYCTGENNNDALVAALANKQDPMAMAAMMNGGGMGGWNNPFIYLVWMMFANRMWNNEGNSPAVNAQLDSLRTQMSDNQNSNQILAAINGNGADLRSLSNNLNCDFNTLQTAICGVKSAIEQVSGVVGYSAESVKNAILLGDQNIMSKMCECCCNTQQSILKMGYDNQLATERQTNVLQSQLAANHSADQLQDCQYHGATMSRIDQLANGIQTGFAQIGYNQQQNLTSILQNNTANTQRIIDTLNNHWSSDLQQKYQDAKLELSQLNQNATLIAALKTTA